MGVELGKRLANNLLDKIQSEQPVTDEDSSTIGLISFYKKNS
jgi:glucose-6-phosphate isomerase